MSGTVSGGKKVVVTRVHQYMSQGYTETEARAKVSEDYRRIGAKGGSVKGTKGGFAAKVPCSCSIIQGQHIKAQCLGAKGGYRSKRRKKNV